MEDKEAIKYLESDLNFLQNRVDSLNFNEKNISLIESEGERIEVFDLAIKALEERAKRLDLIEEYVLKRDTFEYATAKYRYWRDVAETLEECEVDETK